jgi:hypothetical protein
MLTSKRPSFIKDDKLSKVVDNDDVSVLVDKGKVPEYATFDEWKERGYSVMKGERSYQKQNGVPLFHRDQVKKSKSRCYDPYGDLDDPELIDSDDWMFGDVY